MIDAPRQNWAVYDAMTAESDANWVRGLTVDDRFAIYNDLFKIIWSSRQLPGNWQWLDRWLWAQKVQTRLKLVEAFRKLDELHAERAAAKDPG